MMSVKKRVLIVTYGGGHVRMMVPVAQLLKQRSFEVVFLALNSAIPYAKQQGLEVVTYRDLVEPGDEEALRHGAALAAEFSEHAVSFEESAAYLGLSLGSLAEEHSWEGALGIYKKQGRRAFHPVSFMERVIRRFAPDVVVATSSPRSERAAVDAARRMHVPSVCVVDLFAKLEMDWLGRPDYADRLTVLSNSVRDRFLRAGRRSEEIVVAGNPAFDYLGTTQARQRGVELRQRHAWPEGKTVMFISHVMPWDQSIHAGIISVLSDAAMEHGWKFIVRPHPGEQSPAVAQHVHISHNAREPPEVILEAVDAVVTMLSTMGLEAALIGLPIVVTEIYPEILPTWIDIEGDLFLKELGIGELVPDHAGLPAAVQRALAAGRQSYPGLPQMGRATEGVCDVIIETMAMKV